MSSKRVKPGVEFSGKIQALSAEKAKEIYRHEFDCEIVDFKTYKRATTRSPGIYGIWYRPKFRSKFDLNSTQVQLIETEVQSQIIDIFEDMRGNIYEFENGEEWLIFNSFDEAESACIDYVEDQLRTEPTLFDKDWLSNHLYVTETDKRVIANDEADAYVDGLSDEEVATEANMLDEYDDAVEADDQDEIDSIVEDAKDIVMENYADKTEYELGNDLLTWLEERGYNIRAGSLPSFVSINAREAAEDAVCN